MFNFLRKYFLKNKKEKGIYQNINLSAQRQFEKEIENADKTGSMKIDTGLFKIQFDIKDTSLTDSIKSLFFGLENFEINILDHEASQTAREKVYKKFEKQIQNGRVGLNIGKPIAFSIDLFYHIAEELLKVTVVWFGTHLINDLDQKAWKLLKSKLLEVYSLLKKSNKPKGNLVIMIDRPLWVKVSRLEINVPIIEFIFPKNLSINEFAINLEKITQFTTNTLRYHKEHNLESGTYVYLVISVKRNQNRYQGSV